MIYNPLPACAMLKIMPLVSPCSWVELSPGWDTREKAGGRKEMGVSTILEVIWEASAEINEEVEQEGVEF